MNFEELRLQYPIFRYHSYDISQDEQNINIKFKFEIDGLETFCPTWSFPKKGEKIDINSNLFRNLVFHLGLTELVSYWKITCSPKVVIQAGFIDNEQIAWWKKLYFNGLGEFFYVNNISADIETFMDILPLGDKIIIENQDLNKASGCLIPIGGGKDSIVSIELLKDYQGRKMCYIINPRGATTDTAKVAGYSDEDTYEVRRTLDKNMIKLNSMGFLNGHTPFSAIVAFSSLISAHINGLKYVSLSNESSANESTVQFSNVNHQYSKSFEFENDFHAYQQKYIKSGVYYFSFLRPISELQIAALFSQFKKYYSIFKSCNAGSKQNIWCGSCPKCLFVYIILSPFIPQNDMEQIFSKNLFNDTALIPTLNKLTGIEPEKPFECVGSRDEVNFALNIIIEKFEKSDQKLPVLLSYYKYTHLYCSQMPNCNILSDYNNENLLPEEFSSILKNKLSGGNQC